MYIKQVVIDGFKSYKDQTITEPFSPKINVIVGANGSGKSNCFHAIRFVLNDAFTSMQAKERQELLHEGAGHAVLSAFVELVFDNSDGRFPIDKDEVRLRRTIGAKKDEYTLDRKHVTKQEVMNLLESAGFSRSNPYYIVQQGKIVSMANMKDGERLELLKEIGGTKVYEERRRESLKIMQETENRRAQIEEVVEFIESKLEELDAEKAELAAYQALDRQRRSIEYALFDRELAEARAKAAKVDAERAKLGEEAANAQKEAAAAKERLRAVEATIAEAKEAKASAEKARKALAKERDAALKQRAKLELDEKEAAGKLAADTEASAAAKAELAKLSKQIAEAERQVEAASKALDDKKREEKELSEELSSSQARLQALMSKQGRCSQFSSQADRDAFLKGEIKKLQDASSKQEKARAALQQRVEELNAQLMAGAQSAGDRERAVRESQTELEAVSRQLAELKAARDEANNQRKEAWRAADELADEYKRAESEHARASEAARRVIPRDISMGIMAMEAARRRHNIKGVFGSLADLLEVPAQLSTAVEVVCGNQAFQVVVDTTDTGMRLVQELNKSNGGRVTFMPLDALRVPEVAYPTEWGDGAVPMYRVLKYDERFRKAVMQVFGKTVVCQSRDIAEKVAAAGQLDAITLDGDLVRRKGTVSGGFSDPARNKIGSHQRVKALEKQLLELQTRKKAHEAAAAECDQRVAQLSTEVAQLEGKQKHTQRALEQARRDARSVQSGDAGQRKALTRAEEQLAAAEESLADVARKLAAARDELQTDMLEQLSQPERKQLGELQPRVAALKESVEAAKSERQQATAKLEGLQARLATNLLRRREELVAAAEEGSPAEAAALDGLRAELARAAAAVEDVEAQLAEAQGRASAAAEQSKAAEREREALAEAVKRCAEGGEAARLEALEQKGAAARQRADDLSRRIKDLGTLPSEAFEKYRGKGAKELHKSLAKVQEDLGQYSHVNKKALDQYVNFTEQREELHRRRDEVLTGESKIRELISALDMRKDEAIERTFKGVAKNFREVFAALVPNGKGELVMQRRHAGAAAEDDEEEGEGGGSAGGGGAIGKYSGVKVRVAFARGAETTSLRALSGGQKTLVALALIFAIQRCDPAPFYLFDEIDAALDPAYRTSVAALLRAQADDDRNPAMFIVTTFHPQIVLEADKVYGVSHSNRVSQIDVITRDDALTFLQIEEGAEGGEGGEAAPQQPPPGRGGGGGGGGGGGAASAQRRQGRAAAGEEDVAEEEQEGAEDQGEEEEEDAEEDGSDEEEKANARKRGKRSRR